MGINGLWSFFTNEIETVYIDKIYTDSIHDKVINKPLFVVDINLYLHKYIIGIKNSGKDITDNNGKNINHIHAMIKIIKSFTDNLLVPFCIFDGKADSIKEDTLIKRRQIKENAIEECKKIKTLLDEEENIDNNYLYDEYIKNFKKTVSLNSKMIDECKEYLDLCGIPYITSIGESDPQLVGVYHYYKNIIEGIYSEDSDMFLYGADILYKDFDKDKKNFKRLRLEKMLNKLQLMSDTICEENNIPRKIIDKQIFFNFAKILGTDYNTGIRKCGGNNRNKLFEIFVLNDFNLEKFIDNLHELNNVKNEYFVPDDFLEKSELINKYYENIMILNPDTFNVILREPIFDKIKLELKKYNFRTDIINNIVNSLTQFYKVFNKCIKRVYILHINKSTNEWTLVTHKKQKQNCNNGIKSINI
jgi:5'-3' exonuclease